MIQKDAMFFSVDMVKLFGSKKLSLVLALVAETTRETI